MDTAFRYVPIFGQLNTQAVTFYLDSYWFARILISARVELYSNDEPNNMA